MILRAFSIHDVKAETFTPPFYQNTDGQATRVFQDLVNNPDHGIGKHPQDYTIFMVGTFDDNTGHFESISPISLGNGVEFNQMPLPLKE